jgi:hypothetical protein
VRIASIGSRLRSIIATPLARRVELADSRVACLVLGPTCRYELIDEAAGYLAYVGREASAVLRDSQVVAVGSVDLPVPLLEGADGVGRVKHLRASVAGRREARSPGSRMAALEGAKPVGVNAA